MATTKEIMNWEKYAEKYQALVDYGIQTGRVRAYDDSLLQKMRKVSYNGFPVSAVLLCPELCQGYCYQSVLLLAKALKDSKFRVVTADVDMLALNPVYLDKYRGMDDVPWANHCFLEETTPEGIVWVYDTSMGLIFEKNLYYEIQNPQIFTINEQEDFTEEYDFKEYAMPISLEILESMAIASENLYTAALLSEIDYIKSTKSFK